MNSMNDFQKSIVGPIINMVASKTQHSFDDLTDVMNELGIDVGHRWLQVRAVHQFVNKELGFSRTADVTVEEFAKTDTMPIYVKPVPGARNYERYSTMSPAQLQKAIDDGVVFVEYLNWLGIPVPDQDPG
jgi:hypothetical protein